MSPSFDTSSLVNSLALPEQLETSSSRLDGVPSDLESSVHFAGTRLTQTAGILLRLPQDIIAHAIVLYTRFWIGPDGGSLKEYNASDISTAALYLATKLSAHPKSPRSILNVYAFVLSLHHPFPTSSQFPPSYDPAKHYISEGAYHASRTTLFRTEGIVLRVLGFNTHVALPHTLGINYLQALDALRGGGDAGAQLAKRVFAHLNTALCSPQLLYVTHQPAALATAAIYLAAREVGVKLPEEEWWEVFDVDREELGFLVVGLNSMGLFAESEEERWRERACPLRVDEVEAEIRRRGGV